MHRQVARIREALAKVQSEQTKAKTRDDEHKGKQLSINHNVMIFTFLLVVTSAIAGAISLWQGCSTKQSADAAKQNAITTHEALVMDQRPWVFPETFQLDHEPVLNQDTWFNGYISNAGKTPGANVTMSSVIKWWDTEPEVPDFSDLPAPRPSQVVFPGTHKYGFNSFPAKMDEPRFLFFYQNNVPRKTKLYLLMKVAYCDGFGNRYWTTICVSHSYGDRLDAIGFCKRGNGVGQDTTYNSCPK